MLWIESCHVWIGETADTWDRRIIMAARGRCEYISAHFVHKIFHEYINITTLVEVSIAQAYFPLNRSKYHVQSIHSPNSGQSQLDR